MTDLKYIELAIALPVYSTYTYQVPETLSSFVSVGKRVLAPFGLRRVTGYVLGASEAIDRKEIKLILDVLDKTPIFPKSMIPFFKWMFTTNRIRKNAKRTRKTGGKEVL